MKSVKTKSKNNPCGVDATDVCLQRLTRAPETAHQIYELAESLYSRDGGGDSARMTFAEIERIGEYLRDVETDDKRMKKQFSDLVTIPGGFHPEKIPVGF